MREFLNRCRKAETRSSKRPEVVTAGALAAVGAILGAAAKLIDLLAIDNTILWHQLLDTIDLRNILSRLSIWALMALIIALYSKGPVRACINVLGFFTGMLAGYYTITITIAGFFPRDYILAWSIIAFVGSILAFFIWYAKGRGWFALLLSSVILGFFISQSIRYGLFYFYITNYAELVFLGIATGVLYQNSRQLWISLAGAAIIAPFLGRWLPYIFGGL